MTNDFIYYPLLSVILAFSVGATLTLLFVSLYWRNSNPAMTSPSILAMLE